LASSVRLSRARAIFVKPCAVCGSELQRITVCCSQLECVLFFMHTSFCATCCLSFPDSTLQQITVCCSQLECVLFFMHTCFCATCCLSFPDSALQQTALRCNTLHHTATPHTTPHHHTTMHDTAPPLNSYGVVFG